MCDHPTSALRSRVVFVRGYACRHSYCNDCKTAAQRRLRMRERRAVSTLKAAFRQLATARWA